MNNLKRVTGHMGDLKPFRDEIDLLDEQLIELLARRFDIVRKVGALKAREGIEVVQSDRAKEVVERVGAMAQAKGLDSDLMRNIWALMIDRAHVIENEIKNEQSGKQD